MRCFLSQSCKIFTSTYCQASGLIVEEVITLLQWCNSDAKCPSVPKLDIVFYNHDQCSSTLTRVHISRCIERTWLNNYMSRAKIWVEKNWSISIVRDTCTLLIFFPFIVTIATLLSNEKAVSSVMLLWTIAMVTCKFFMLSSSNFRVMRIIQWVTNELMLLNSGHMSVDLLSFQCLQNVHINCLEWRY